MSDEVGGYPEHAAPEPEGYDAWFREQVEAALREADDSNAQWYTLEESDERMRLLKAAHRAEKLQKAS